MSVHRFINSSPGRSVTLPIGIAILDVFRTLVTASLTNFGTTAAIQKFRLFLSLSLSLSFFPISIRRVLVNHPSLKILRVKDKSANGGSAAKRRGYYWRAGGITLPLSFISRLRFPFFVLESPAGWLTSMCPLPWHEARPFPRGTDRFYSGLALFFCLGTTLAKPGTPLSLPRGETTSLYRASFHALFHPASSLIRGTLDGTEKWILILRRSWGRVYVCMCVVAN